MNATYLPVDLYLWLSNKAPLMKYLTIDTYPATIGGEQTLKKKEQIKKWRKQTLCHMVKFQSEVVKDGALDDRILLKKPSRFASNALQFEFHKFKFIQFTIRNELHKQYENSVLLCQDLIEILGENSILPSDIDLSVDERGLFRYALSQPSFLRFLLKKETYLYKTISMFCAQPSSREMKSMLYDIICVARPLLEKTTQYFPQIPCQMEFDELIVSNVSPVKNDILMFLETFPQLPKSRFITEVLNMFHKFYSSLKISNSTDLSILVLFFIRSLFSFAENENPEYFNIAAATDVSQIASKIPCSFINPPEMYLDFKPNDTLFEAFGKDEFLRPACHRFVDAKFHNNPIDALYEIHQALVTIVHASNLKFDNCELSTMPFDTSFGLFIGTLVASGCPKFEETASYILTFSPQQGLSPEFEYALTTTAASLRYCGTLTEKFGTY